MEFEIIYNRKRESTLVRIAEFLENELIDLLKSEKHIDRITSRAKTTLSFILKANKQENGLQKYNDPLTQIQDQVGVRVVTFYLDDVEAITKTILSHYRPIEQKSINPDSEKEFGYFGKHFILLLPSDARVDGQDENLHPLVFELQIKTLFQHAFSEASHDLSYKPTEKLTKDQNRKIAFTAAQSWGADMIFNELKNELT